MTSKVLLMGLIQYLLPILSNRESPAQFENRINVGRITRSTMYEKAPFCSVLLDSVKSLISRINEVNVFFNKKQQHKLHV